MNRAFVTTTSVCLAFFLAACGTSPPNATTTSEDGGSNSSNVGGSKANNSAGGSSSTNGTSSQGGSTGTTQATSSQGGNAISNNSGQGGGSVSSSSGPKGGSTVSGSTVPKGGSSTAGPAGGSAVTNPGGGAPGDGGKANQGGKTNQGGKSAGQGGASAGGAKNTGNGGAPTGGASNPSAAGTSSTTPIGDEPQLITSADGAFWKIGTLTTSTSGTADVTVNDSGSTRWDGFGGCFNEAGWDALSVLSDGDRQLAIKLLYDAVDGANFAYGRIPIGASDYAMSRYTLAETSGDYTMDKFSIDRDRKQLIPYIKAAIAVKSNIHFWASPWTPPAWMKDNNSTDDGNMKSDDKTLSAFALYLEKFVQEYGKEGIPIEAIHPQNEPGYVNPYPSCKWSSDLYIKFIRDYLGPKFAADNIAAEIWCGTMSAPSDGTIATSLAADSKAMGFVKGFGLQWNTKDKVSSLKSKGSVMQTEHKCGNYDFATDYWDQSKYSSSKPQNDYAYGVESWKNIKDWVNAGVNSYSAWNMVLDTSGANLNASKPWHQNALLVVDRGAKKLIQTPAYYVFRHLSQYVDPGAKVLSTSGGDALAFKNPDGTYVAVIYNSGAAKTMTVSVGSKKVQFSAPNNGWATVNYK